MPSLTNIIRKAAGKLVGGQSAAVAAAAEGARAAVAPQPVQVVQGKRKGGDGNA